MLIENIKLKLKCSPNNEHMRLSREILITKTEAIPQSVLMTIHIKNYPCLFKFVSATTGFLNCQIILRS